MSKRAALISYFLLSLCFFLVPFNRAVAADSTQVLHDFNDMTAMAFATVTANINVTANNSPIYQCVIDPVTGKPKCNFAQVALCPPGSTYYSPGGPFTSGQIDACRKGSAGPCSTGMSKNSSGTLNFAAQCSLTLQGWFKATDIKAIIKKGSNTQPAAPINNFNLGTYAVTLVCGAMGCSCSVTDPNGQGGTISGYGNLCAIAGSQYNKVEFPYP